MPTLDYKLIAFTDLETTGLDPTRHEIIEIGLVLADRDTLEIKNQWSVKVQPTHPETADPVSLQKNTYNPAGWHAAVPLETALREYAALTAGSLFCSYNAMYDWMMLELAIRRFAITLDMDYHRLDLFSIAWTKLIPNPPPGFKLREVAGHLGLTPEPMPHSALNGARSTYEVYTTLLPRT